MSAALDLAALLMRRSLWIFDLDGTLADTTPIHRRAFAEALAPHGVPVDYAHVAGLTTEDALDALFAAAGVALAPELRKQLVADKQMRARTLIEAGLAPLPGVSEFVASAGARKLAICSSGSSRTVDVTLRAIGLRDSFGYVVSGQDVLRAKPDPEGFLAVLEYYGADCEEAVIFEDSAAGLAAAAAAEISAVQIVSDGPVAHGEQGWRSTWPALVAAMAETVA